MRKQEVRKRSIPPDELAVLVAAGLDLLGEPPATWHPVVWYGRLIRCLEQAAPRGHLARFCYGALMLLQATVLVLPLALLTRGLARRIYLASPLRRFPSSRHILYALLVGGALKPFFALRMLVDAGRTVRLLSEQHDLLAAREALRSLVSRERSQLTAEQVMAAAIESLAENLNDSVVAPLFYYTVSGLPGAALYRLYNTFDSMIGYHGHYEYLGKAAARLDDLLNLVPARLTALLIIAAAPLYGGNRRRGWRVWLRDARKTASPNAGHPMSAAAGALGVRLDKVLWPPQSGSEEEHAIICGNGSSELIWTAARTLLSPGKKAAVIGPTFGEYAAASRAAGATVVEWRARAEMDFVPDLAALGAWIEIEQPALVWLCNPNNPTGFYLDTHGLVSIAEICKACQALLVVDEAYLRFAHVIEPSTVLSSSLALLATDYQVLILRSLTKDYALAGVRLGYAVGPEDIIQQMYVQLPSWNVNGLAQSAGCAALSDQDHLARTLTQLASERAAFFQALAQTRFRIVRSHTHFCLIEVGEASYMRQQLLKRKMLVRDCTSFGLPGFIRVSTRPELDWRTLMATLGEVI